MWLLAWRNLWRNPQRSRTLLILLSLGIGSLLFFYSLFQGWMASTLNFSLQQSTQSMQIHAPGYQDDPRVETFFSATAHQIAALELLGFTASARLITPGLVQSEYASQPISLIGLHPEDERQVSAWLDRLQPPDAFTNQSLGLVMSAQLARQLETQVGRRVVLMAQGLDKQIHELGLPLLATFENLGQTDANHIYLPRPLAEKLLGLTPTDSHELALQIPNAKDLSHLNPLKLEVEKIMPHTQVQTWAELQPFILDTQTMMDAFVWVWLGFIMLLMLLGLLSSLMMSLYERSTELRLLHQMGLGTGALIRLLLMEWFILLSFASALAWLWVSGLILWASGGIDLSELMSGLAYFGMDQRLYLPLPLNDWLMISGLNFTLLISLSAFAIGRACLAARKSL